MNTGKSELFTNYNKMRATAADRPRLNRALGVAQSKSKRPYNTTATGCDCPDSVYRKVICKHRLGLALVA